MRGIFKLIQRYFFFNLYENYSAVSTTSPVNLCIKREVIPNNVIPLPRCSDRSPETPPKFAAPPDVEKCHFRVTPIGSWENFGILKHSIILVMWGTKRKLSMSEIIKTYLYDI